MALLADRIVYRLAAVWWTAIYGGLLDRAGEAKPTLDAHVIGDDPSTLAAVKIAVAA